MPALYKACKLGNVFAYHNKKTQIVDDVSLDTDYVLSLSTTRSEIAIPIILKDAVVGVINVEHPETNAFDEEDKRNLELLATQAASAIQNSHLYRELEQHVRLLDTANKLARDITVILI